MIVGLLADITKQKSVLPAAVVRAIEALQKIDLSKVEAGRYEIQGDKLFYLIQDVETRSFDESKSEAHHNYADIQIPLTGAERYGSDSAPYVASENQARTGVLEGDC